MVVREDKRVQHNANTVRMVAGGCRKGGGGDHQNLPVKVSVHGFTPANLLDVPKSEILRTPL